MDNFYTSYSTDPQDVVEKIQLFIAQKGYDFVRTKLQDNPHDFGSYRSVEIFWTNSERFHELQDDLDPSPEDDEVFDGLEGELTALNGLETEISEKFNKYL